MIANTYVYIWQDILRIRYNQCIDRDIFICVLQFDNTFAYYFVLDSFCGVGFQNWFILVRRVLYVSIGIMAQKLFAGHKTPA